MKFPILPAVLVGLAAGTVLPTLASVPSRFETRLSHNQRDFIQEVDDALGTELLDFAQTPAARPFVQVAYLVCGQKELQEQILTSLGASQTEMKYAMERFEGGFCPGC